MAIQTVIKFRVSEADALAAFLCRIIREGLVHEVTETGDGWRVTLTGGY